MFPAATERWVKEHVRPATIDFDSEGRRVVIETHPIISLRESWFRSHGMGDMFQEDGTVWLDSAGEYRYRKIKDLPNGGTAYERIPT